MKLPRVRSTLAPFLMLPALALAVAPAGCAANEEEAASSDSAATAAAGVEFTSAVGALVVDGKKLCTAALVDVDAGARIGHVSAHGRQIVFGGACVGQLRNGVTGAAVFVTQQNGLRVSSPIVAFDFESQASAGLAVGILSEPVQGAEPLDIVGVSAITNAGVHTATVLEASEDGLLIGAATEIHAGVDLSLNTHCSSLAFGVKAGVAVGAGVAVRDDGLGAAAFVRIDGRLHFAAHIDGACVVRHFDEAVHHISVDVLEAANEIGNTLSSLGTGDVVAVVHTKTRRTTVKIKLTEDVLAIRVNGQGHISAQARGATCDKIPLLVLGGPCELRPQDGRGYRVGELVTIAIDTHLNLFPNTERGEQLTISTTNDPPPSPPDHDPFSGGG